MITFTVEPDWQPMETAPKDGSMIAMLVLKSNFRTEGSITFVKNVRWGVMKAYPDQGEYWIPDDGYDNSLMDETPWSIERHLYNEYGTEREHNLWRGESFVAWAEVWETKIEIKLPPLPEVKREEVIFDSRWPKQ